MVKRHALVAYFRRRGIGIRRMREVRLRAPSGYSDLTTSFYIRDLTSWPRSPRAGSPRTAFCSISIIGWNWMDKWMEVRLCDRSLSMFTCLEPVVLYSASAPIRVECNNWREAERAPWRPSLMELSATFPTPLWPFHTSSTFCQMALE
jgi:hypothetical protein